MSCATATATAISSAGASVTASRMCSSLRAGTVAANFGLEVLVAGAVANVQDEAPDEVGGEASGKDYDENRKSLPQDRGAVLDA